MKRFLYLLSAVVLVGCGSKEPKRPEGLLPEAKMVQLLADVHIAEARIESRIVYPDTALMVFNREQQQIFEEHGVAPEDFRKTYQFYLENLSQMDRLYEVILDTLSVREAKLRANNPDNRVEQPAARPVPGGEPLLVQ